MSLTAGTRLGPYEIVSPLGAGGMGEVYRARDTRLDRTVVLKVLPADLAGDPVFRARFDREARAISQLQHPHICTLHDVGEADGTAYFVMELVQGQTLAERLTKGALPLYEALSIAIEVADALAAAHRQGIVHRDLKPGNIMLAKAGTGSPNASHAKLLDFGLAKPTTSVAVSAASSTDETAATAASAHLTGAGTILGTLHYMAPEQVEGKDADARSDIWAFGAVLYEMLTGHVAFSGESSAAVVGAILKDRPLPLSTRRPDVSPLLEHIAQRCLEKDPEERWQGARDLHRELLWLSGNGGGRQGSSSATPGRRSRRAGIAAISVGVLVSGAAATWLITRQQSPISPAVIRSVLPPSPGEVIGSVNPDPDLAISQDGLRVAYIGMLDGQQTLFARPLESLESQPIRGLHTPRNPILSPDAEWIGYFDGTQALKKVRFSGGPAVTICRTGSPTRGASWSPNDAIVFATAAPETGLLEVSANGGTPTVLTRPDPNRGESDHIQPDVLPDGNAVLFTIVSAGAVENRAVAVLERKTGSYRTLVPGGSYPRYAASGHLLYVSNGTLQAVAFDARTLQVVGAPAPIAQHLAVKTVTGAAGLAVAQNGTLAYLLGDSDQAYSRTLAWVDREGHEDAIPAPARGYTYPRISPDGHRVAFEVRDQEFDIWVWDFDRKVLTRATFGPVFDQWPTWSPDSSRILFSDGTRILSRAADGRGDTTTIASPLRPLYPLSFTSHGHGVVALHTNAQTGADLVFVPVTDDSGAAATDDTLPLVNTGAQESNGEISPDGRWIAYESDESGRFEVYVRSFPELDHGRWQVSYEGGSMPLWSRSGRELFYRRPDGRLASVQVENGAGFKADAPRVVLDRAFFAGPGSGRTYDVSSDATRFLIIKEPPAASALQLVVVQNAFEELKTKVPVR